MPLKKKQKSSARNSHVQCSHCEYVDNDKPTADDGIEFATQFTSPTLRVLVGLAKVEYHLHKQVLILKSPYFATLLSSPFAGLEMHTGTLTLESDVDTEDAFQMFVEYVYISDYDPPKGLGRDQRCLLHASVYVLAERLCMDDLKSLSLEKMVPELAGAYDNAVSKMRASWDFESAGDTSSDGRLQTQTVVGLVENVYKNIPDPIVSGDPIPTVNGLPQEAPAITVPIEIDKAEVGDTTPVPLHRDKMRSLIARYAASDIERMKESVDFMELVRTRCEFARDLTSMAKNGDKVRSDELQRL